GVLSGSRQDWSTFLVRSQGQSGSFDLGDIDVDHFIDYLVPQWHAGSGDWPWNNYYVGLNAQAPHRARFITWDAEISFWPIRYHTSNPGAWVHPYFTRSRPRGMISGIWQTLRQEPSFRDRLADRVSKLCGPGGVLSDEVVRARFLALAERLEGAILAEACRWGDAAWGREESPRTVERDWLPQRDKVLELIDGNSQRFVVALRGAGLYPRVETPTVARSRTGRWVLRGALKGGKLYYTLNGEDPKSSETRIVDSGEVVLPAPPFWIRARFELGGTWSAMLDRSVRSTTTRSPFRISEILCRSVGESDLEFVELQNRSGATIPLEGYRVNGLRYRFPRGAVAKPYARIVLVPRGTREAYRKRYSGRGAFGEYIGRLDDAGEELRVVDSEGRSVDFLNYRPLVEASPKLVESGRSLVLGDDGSWQMSNDPGGNPGR
ncbi:MAG: CotH kinase family protein, partial [Planctomycetota bacterium]